MTAPDYSTMACGPNPSGLCQCGCGQTTPIGKSTVPRLGLVAGTPVRYMPGHSRKLPEPGYVIDELTGCWIWQRSIRVKERGGPYGCTSVGRRTTSAHHAMWERHHGPIPPGMELDHLCKNTLCVNPAHLECVTRTTNVRRSSLPKLSVEIAEEIRRLYADGGHSQRALALRFGTDQGTVSRIIAGERWVPEGICIGPWREAWLRAAGMEVT